MLNQSFASNRDNRPGAFQPPTGVADQLRNIGSVQRTLASAWTTGAPCTYRTVPGTFRSGVVHLAELPPDLPEGRVPVTFLECSDPTQGKVPALSPEQIAELRGQLAAWDEDWNSPGMEAYDKP